MHTDETEIRVSPPTDSPQFLVRTYSTPHGFVTTVATRQHAGETWGPEYEVHPEPAENVGRVVL